MEINFPFVDLALVHGDLRPQILKTLSDVYERRVYICGSELEQFEIEWAKYCGVKYAIGVSNGLDALALILKALEIGPGDEVILPANTFIATALAVSQVGATPVLVDVDEASFNLSLSEVEKSITKKTKAIIPVHLYGRLADMKGLVEISNLNKIWLIEDAAQAHGAEVDKIRAGAFGIAGAFSFYPGKNLGALGDGGGVVTNDEALAKKIRKLRNYGSETKYYHDLKGSNARLDEIQAAVLRVKLNYLESWNSLRREMASVYQQALADTPLVLPLASKANENVWHLYVVKTKNRKEVQETLLESGIQSSIHYPVPIHLQRAFSDLNKGLGSFPVSERLANEILSLPFWIGLNVSNCAKAIKKSLKY
ncbi:MAG: DegT/DnrJ/EryC1/StrS family aminotransferase [Pseudomonadota bacterium]|nr:DegT/DnrJ/EryC1/StrS family aminotransferase [Pseudomonadota bacterium]